MFLAFLNITVPYTSLRRCSLSTTVSPSCIRLDSHLVNTIFAAGVIASFLLFIKDFMAHVNDDQHRMELGFARCL